ncbi:TonB-dependent receptor [Azoarcus indigens]|uniref:TonB-dependent receptor-like protein n=1 Tax=Azoarcus indigens TaxID=29545 RepID=A0A4R6DJL7_9RHOO|nr:TonB-dependent receptor [Azoarcus indigens]NMG66958.1 TonB-dependent receptor [Azoarcus indigens]TDN44996.1 TonB-dependent receptor-like protein [Azoarcus indigens]
MRTARPSYVPIAKNPPKTAESTNQSLAIATLSLYGNYIESLEAGPTAPGSAANAGEVFAPSKTKQVELGAKLDFGRFELTTGIFEIEHPSGLTDASNYYSMDGRQRNRGLELSLFGKAQPELRLPGGLTYIDSEMLKTQNGQYDGKTAAGVPRLSAVQGFEWDLPFVAKLTLTGRANPTGRQYIANDNSRTIPAYTLYGMGARYKTTVRGQTLILRANIDNLFDKDYWTSEPDAAPKGRRPRRAAQPGPATPRRRSSFPPSAACQPQGRAPSRGFPPAQD